MDEVLAPAPTRSPDFVDDFRDGLDAEKWIAHYLPQWTVPERSEARYGIVESGLQLRIESDQLDWREEDAPMRVTNLQTAVFSGPLGSGRGTHRHRPDGLEVRTAMPARMLFAPSRGRVDLTVGRWRDDDRL